MPQLPQHLCGIVLFCLILQHSPCLFPSGGVWIHEMNSKQLNKVPDLVNPALRLPQVLTDAVCLRSLCSSLVVREQIPDTVTRQLGHEERFQVFLHGSISSGQRFELGKSDGKNQWFSCCSCFLGVPFVHLWCSRSHSEDLGMAWPPLAFSQFNSAFSLYILGLGDDFY